MEQITSFFKIAHQLSSQKETVETVFETNLFRIERIVSNGFASPENVWYNQEQDEWVMMMQGVARLEFRDGIKREIHSGDFLFIPAHQEHRVDWVSKMPNCIWLAIFPK